MEPYNQLKSEELLPFIKLKNSNGSEDIHYSVFNDDVPIEFKSIAEVELSETEEKKRKGIQRLREVLKEKDISGIEDTILLSTLRKCKNNLSKSESQLMKYLKTRKMIFERLKSADMKRLEHVLDHLVVGLLPYRDRKGRAIFFTTPNVNLELFDVYDAVICFYIAVNFLLTFPMTSIVGVNYIGECKTPTVDILYPLIKAFQQHWSDIASFPGRVTRIDFLNEIFIIRWTWNLLKGLLPAKTIGRLWFHGSDISNLQEIYHPSLLPEEFGGTMGPLSNKFYKEKLLNYMKKLKNETTT